MIVKAFEFSCTARGQFGCSTPYFSDDQNHVEHVKACEFSWLGRGHVICLLLKWSHVDYVRAFEFS